jgi:hypothetical protein
MEVLKLSLIKNEKFPKKLMLYSLFNLLFLLFFINEDIKPKNIFIIVDRLPI